MVESMPARPARLVRFAGHVAVATAVAGGLLLMHGATSSFAHDAAVPHETSAEDSMYQAASTTAPIAETDPSHTRTHTHSYLIALCLAILTATALAFVPLLGPRSAAAEPRRSIRPRLPVSGIGLVARGSPESLLCVRHC
jgi:hypothetical protein